MISIFACTNFRVIDDDFCPLRRTFGGKNNKFGFAKYC